MSTPDPATLLHVEALRSAHLPTVSFTLSPGECVSLGGPSGVGKSVLLRALADLDPNDGEIVLAGEPRGGIKAHEWRRRVGLLPAEPAWWAETVGEHFAVDLESLAALGLPAETPGWNVSRLSTGERQRLALLRLLSQRPRVLLLDEPTANLDDENTERAERLIAGYLRDHGAAALWVSHDQEQRERVGHRELRLTADGLQAVRP